MADQSSRQLRVTVLGGGSWGTTVAHLAAHNNPTRLWARDDATVAAINDQHRNLRYLADYDLHPNLVASSDFDELVTNTDLLVMGVPTGAFREVCQRAAPLLRPWVPVISLAKGFEAETNKRMTQIIGEELPSRPIGVLTGPNLAKEILAGNPAAAVIALTEHKIAAELQSVFTTSTFRVFTNHDVVGCELGGALKNVYAVVAGTVEGRNLGDNARASVITRGLAELIELGTALGGEALTLAGLAGMGDLIATCISPQSRNGHVGRMLGEGKSLDQILEEMSQVAEGVKATRAVLELAKEHDVMMPIASYLSRVCFDGRDLDWAQEKLLKGEVGHERGVLGPNQ